MVHKGLVTNYGERGATKRENGGGASEVLSRQKRVGDGKVLAMLKGGTTSFEVVLKWELDGGGGRKTFPPFKRGVGAKSFKPVIFPFCSSPPFPVINDQSLI